MRVPNGAYEHHRCIAVAARMMENQHMELRPETRETLQRVEELSGKPVEIIQDASQPHLARITRARQGVPSHLLRVNPSLGEPDYLIVYECGFILRLYELPPEERREFAGAAQARTEVDRLVKQAGQTAQLPNDVKVQLAQQLTDGLLTQLRSYPIGMRIDSWIHETFPALDDLQREAIVRQQQENLSVLKPEIKAFAPKPILDANVSMNAAYAIYCDRVFGKSGYAIPYRSAGYEKRGRKLLDIMQSIPNVPTSDRALVDAWAQELGLTDWYQWVALRP
jgi:hypothetical protein